MKTIGLLNAYHFETTPGSYQEKYEPMILSFLSKILTDHNIKVYKTAQGELPNHPDECDAWIVTGSPAASYGTEKWIKELTLFIKNSHAQKKKMLGICFGHQIIALSLGGEVKKSDKGWGIGIREFEITKEKKWMKPPLNGKCSLLFSHQDHVTKLPENALQLGTDSFCHNQMYSIEDHIFSMQGHPEFTREYAKARYDTRKDLIGPLEYNKAIESLKKETDDLSVGEWIRNFLNS